MLHVTDIALKDVNSGTETPQQDLMEALRESEERFRSAFEHAAIGMALVGLDGRWLQVNRSLCEILGYSEAEMLATDFQAITHPQDLHLDMEYVRRLVVGEIRTYQMTKRYFHRDGRIVWVQLSVSLVRGKGREPLYFISQINDVSERKATEDALLQSEAKFRQLIDQAADGVFVHDRRGRILDANPVGCQSLGYTREELVALNVIDFEVGTSPEQLLSAWGGLVVGQPLTLRGTHRRKNGSTFPVEVRAGLVETGGAQLVLALVRDVSERVRNEAIERGRREALEQIAKGSAFEDGAHRLAELIEQQMPGTVAAFLTLRDGNIALTGPTLPPGLRDTIGKRPLTATSELCDNIARDRSPVCHDFRQSGVWADLRSAAAAGGLRGCWAFPIDASDATPLGVLAIFTRAAREPLDWERALCFAVTNLAALAVERRQLADNLARRAYYDPLTGLCNRAMFNEKLVQAMDSAERGAGGALLLLDLDRFKEVNDRLGHDAGDELLQQFAQRLRQVFGEQDTFARLGGDEFAVLLPGAAHRPDAAAVAGQIVAALEHPFQLNDEAVCIASSIGGAVFPLDAENPQALLKAADNRLYRVKQAGRNGFDVGAP